MNSPVRWIAWCGVILLAAWGLFGGWVSSPAVVDDPPPAALEELAALAEEEYADWLTAFAETLDSRGPRNQVLLVQAVPEGSPIVIAAIRDAGDNEEATHWPVPWPAVEDLLQNPLTDAASVTSSYAGYDYQHRVIPIDSTGTRCLLVNRWGERQSWWGLRTLALLLCILMVIGLVATREN